MPKDSFEWFWTIFGIMFLVFFGFTCYAGSKALYQSVNAPVTCEAPTK